MMKNMISFRTYLVLPAVCIGLCLAAAQSAPGAEKGRAADQTVTLPTLLQEMIDRDHTARLPDPAYTCKQFSSYDRNAVAPDQPNWFANSDRNQYLRTEENQGRQEHVLMDTPGPGAIVRFWSTTMAAPNIIGTLRIYLDSDPTPVIEGPYHQLIAGAALVHAPLSAEQAKPTTHPLAGGLNLYLPIPYARHCKVTYQGSSEQRAGHYYNINYRTYPPDTAVQTFSLQNLTEHKPLLARVQRTLLDPNQTLPPLRYRAFAPAEPLAPGDRLTANLTGPAALRKITLQLHADDLPQALRSTILTLTFDDQQTVWCPAGDFFGTAAGIHPFKTWWRQIDPQGLMTCYWPMPFQRTARIELHNIGSQPVRAALHVGSADWTWDESSLYFHTNWRYRYPVNSRPIFDWNFIEITGQGLLVADTLASMDTHPWWWGEGDEKIYVDGEPFPSTFGTGTEDYYGYAQGVPSTFSAPFHAMPHVDGPMSFGHATQIRDRLLDTVPFTTALKFDMELFHNVDTVMAFGTTTHWYARPDATCNIQPQPDQAKQPIPSPPPPPQP